MFTWGSPIPLVLAGASNKGGVRKTSHFLVLNVNISKTHQTVWLSTLVVDCRAVSVGPKFAASHKTTAYAWAGRRRNMTCRVLAEPDVVIEWLRGGLVLDNNETFSTIQTRVWRTSVSHLQVSGPLSLWRLMLPYGYSCSASCALHTHGSGYRVEFEDQAQDWVKQSL